MLSFVKSDGSLWMSRNTVIARLALAVLFAPTAVSGMANTLYRCIGPTGTVSYQGQACDSGSRLDRAQEFQPDPVADTANTSPSPIVVHAHRWRYSRNPGRAVRVSYRTSHQRSPSDRCRAAKEHRSSALERLGLHRTYADLSRLDEPVRAVCRGF